MNAARRKEIDKARAMIEEAKGLIEAAQSDEQDYFDNMPENMQGGERGQKAEQSADALQEAADACDEVLQALETATE